MAKQSVIDRNLKRMTLVEKKSQKRSALLAKRNEAIKLIAQSDDSKTLDQARKDLRAAMNKLDKMPKNSCKDRIRNRCNGCGRSRGTYRAFGYCRMCIRVSHALGHLPGVKKSSW